MEYQAKKDTLVLSGDACLWQGQKEICADRIKYDTKKSRIKASSNTPSADPGKPAPSRIRIILPGKKPGAEHPTESTDGKP